MARASTISNARHAKLLPAGFSSQANPRPQVIYYNQQVTSNCACTTLVQRTAATGSLGNQSTIPSLGPFGLTECEARPVIAKPRSR